jgi:hypothetical protein
MPIAAADCGRTASAMHIQTQQLFASLLWWSEDPPTGIWQWPPRSIMGI